MLGNHVGGNTKESCNGMGVVNSFQSSRQEGDLLKKVVTILLEYPELALALHYLNQIHIGNDVDKEKLEELIETQNFIGQYNKARNTILKETGIQDFPMYESVRLLSISGKFDSIRKRICEVLDLIGNKNGGENK